MIRYNTQSFRFENNPFKYSCTDYEEIRNRYVDQVLSLKGVKSIYQMGTISAPGISDIDLILVIDNQLRKTNCKLYSSRYLGEKGRYLFMHPGAMIVNESTFKHLPFLFYCANLHHIAGDRITQVRLKEYETDVVNYSIIIDASVHLAQKLLKYLISKRIDIRRALMNLSAVNYSIILAEKCGIPIKEDWKYYITNSKTLKSEWNFNEDKSQLIRLLYKSINILYEILFYIAKALKEKRFLNLDFKCSGIRHKIFTSHDSALIFYNDCKEYNYEDPKVFGKINFQIDIKKKNYSSVLSVVYLPSIFYWHFRSHSMGATWLAKSIKQIFPIDKGVNHKHIIASKQYCEVIAKRIDLWCLNLDFLARLHLLDYDIMPIFIDLKRYIISNNLSRLFSQVVPYYISLCMSKHSLKNI